MLNAMCRARSWVNQTLAMTSWTGDASARELDVTPVFSGSVLDNLRNLVAGDLDLVLADERVALYELNVNLSGGIRKTLILPKAYTTRGLRIGVSKRRTDHAEIAGGIRDCGYSRNRAAAWAS